MLWPLLQELRSSLDVAGQPVLGFLQNRATAHLSLDACMVHKRPGVCCEATHCCSYVSVDLCNLLYTAGLLQMKHAISSHPAHAEQALS